VRQALRDFLAALPDLLRQWFMVGVPTILIGFLLFREWNIVEAMAGTIPLLPIGVSFLGFLWLYPLSKTRLSWARWWFAVLWWLVTLLPTLGVYLFLAGVIRVLLGSS
jgi:hypothetical protein